MGIGREILELSEKIKYSFSDVSHLQIALTHSSYSNEMKKKGFRAESNEAYEFLGDAVLELMISEELFRRFQKDGEGALTKYRQRLVCEGSLARIASAISLGDFLNVASAEEATNLRNRPKVLADALEALIAAIYIDAVKSDRLDLAKSVILALFEKEITAVINRISTDYKSMLQQFVEKNTGSELRYEHTESGPEHKKSFKATAYINNNPVGEGVGKTKRTAETNAAEVALRLFGIIE